MDSELIRIQGILNALEDLNQRWWRLKRDLGEDATKRAIRYINARMGWVFRRFTEEQSCKLQEGSVVVALAFVDDSGSGGDSPYFVLGGYVASPEVWDYFVPAWESILDSSPRLEYFKMSEAESLKGQFAGFSAKNRTERLGKFIDVILDHDLFEWSVVISNADYREILLPTLLPQFRSPYYYALMGMLTALSGRYRWAGSDEQVHFILDTQKGMEHHAHLICNSFRKWHPTWRIGHVAFRNDKEHPPLQAADLIAWQTRRFMSEAEPTRSEFRRLHSKYPGQSPRALIKRSDLSELARVTKENLPTLLEEFGEEKVQQELGKIHRKNQRQRIPSPDFISEHS